MAGQIIRRGFSRRRVLGVGAVAGAGAVVLGACGETVEVIKEVPVEVVKEVQVAGETVIKEVEVEVAGKTVVKEVEVPVEVIKEVEVEKVVEVEAAPVVGAATGSGRWAGETFNYAGLESMGSAVINATQPWFDVTGAEVNRAAFGQQELEDKALQAMATGTYFADAFQFNSNSAGDVMAGGLLLPVPNWVKDKIEWDDIMPLFREKIVSWEGTAFSLPYDGDKHYMAYRRDLMLDQANADKFQAENGYAWDPETGPRTWDEHRDIAKFFTGWDWEGDGSESHSGFSHMMKRKDTLWWGANSRFTAYNKHPEDKGYLFDVDTMEPRVNNEGFIRALEEWKDEFELYGPETSLNDGWGSVIENYVTAKSFMCIGWSDHGTAAQDTSRSVIKGLSGYSKNPGSKEVFNARTGKWENFPEINYASFIAFGGWIIAVPSNTKNAEMAWDWGSFATGPHVANQMVTAPTGVNPLRFSQMDPQIWVDSAFEWGEDEAIRMLKGESDTINDPNAVADLRVPGWVQYRDAFELHVSRALAGEADVPSALDDMATEFEEITVRMGGPDKQLPFYRSAMGAS